MDSFINQKEIAAGWEEREGGKEGRREGGAVGVFVACVKSALSAEGQRCIGRAVALGPLHSGFVSLVHPGRRPSRGAAAAAAGTRSPEISQVLRRVRAWRGCQSHSRSHGASPGGRMILNVGSACQASLHLLRNTCAAVTLRHVRMLER